MNGLPADITQDADPGVATAIVNWVVPTVTDNSGSHTMTSSHSPGQPFPIGVTVVEYTAVDQVGNTESQTFNITINGNKKADFTLLIQERVIANR